MVAALAGTSLLLQPVARVQPFGPAVRFDDRSFDPQAKRLWIAHMDANQLLVFDVVHRRLVKTISAPGARSTGRPQLLIMKPARAPR